MDQNEKSRWRVTGVQRDEQFHINTMAEIAREGLIFVGKVDTFRGEKVLVVQRKDFEEAVLSNDKVRRVLSQRGDYRFLDRLVVFRFKLDNLRAIDPRSRAHQKATDLRAV